MNRMQSGTAIPGSPRDLVGYNGSPPKVEWPNGARVAVQLVVNFEEGSERSIGDGDDTREAGGASPVTVRDLAVESMFEYGTRAGFWRLMDIFDEFDVKSTFFAAAVALERNPDAAAMLRPRGHDVMSHGYRWEDAVRLSRDEEREHMRLAVESITRTTGERPLGWYCRYGPSSNTRELVVEEGGFLYDSDSYNDDLPYWTMVGDTRHLVIPYSLASNDGKFSQRAFGSPVEFEEYLIWNVDQLRKEGATHPKMMSLGLHLRFAGLPAQAQAVARFLEYATALPDVWFARRDEIARHWIANYS
jgi:peptidoglycan/xylan/chitin deacetylase (PgdA/CDA1 family)